MGLARTYLLTKNWSRDNANATGKNLHVVFGVQASFEISFPLVIRARCLVTWTRPAVLTTDRVQIRWGQGVGLKPAVLSRGYFENSLQHGVIRIHDLNPDYYSRLHPDYYTTYVHVVM